jgi:hypothetical protein
MPDFLMLMHNDAVARPLAEMWPTYLTRLRYLGVFDGGSGIGPGKALRKDMAPQVMSGPITGYIRVRAENLAEAAKLLSGNPVFEGGGTVEIRELSRN